MGQRVGEGGYIFTLLEHNAGGIAHDLGVQVQRVQGDQGFGPLHAFGDARCALEGIGERLAAQTVDHVSHLTGQMGGGARHLRADDFQLAVPVGVIQPVVKAAALDRVIELAGAVAGENSDRLEGSADGADFGNTDLVFTQVLQQKGLKRFVGAVDLIDE